MNILREILPTLRLKVVIESCEGPSISFDIDIDTFDEQKILREIHNLPERLAKKRKKRFVVVIDELREISNLGGITIEKGLRAALQLHNNVSYVSTGNKREVY